MPQFMRSSNPALGDKAFRTIPGTIGARMTIDGAVNKTGILLLIAVATAAFTWHLFIQSMQSEELNPMGSVGPWMMIGLFGGFITAMITIFKKEWSAITAPTYAAFEGLLLGGLSAQLEMRFPGIAIQSVCLTFGTLFVLLFAYRARIIPVSRKFMLGVVAATGAIALFYLLEMVLSLFHIQFTSINGSGPLGIGFSLIVVGVAALNLVLDFAFIESSARYGAPKYMEWYSAFSLMLTLVWLYLEMIRLLSKVRSRN